MQIAGSGTQTATLDTEHTLHSDNDLGPYELVVDCGALAAGDRVVLRAKQRVLAAGAVRLIQELPLTYGQVASEPVVVLGPFTNVVNEAGSIVFTLEQTDGTGRAFPWSVALHA